jgi:hypothetical protein
VALLGQDSTTTPRATTNRLNQRRSKHFVHRCDKLPHMSSWRRSGAGPRRSIRWCGSPPGGWPGRGR